VRKHQGAVFGVAYHWTRSYDEAQDIAQETFFTAFAALGDLAQPEKFSAWVRGIATNHCRMWKRAQQRGAISLDAPGSEALRTGLKHPTPTPLEDWERQQRRQAVEEILGLLPESQRLPAALYYVDGFSQREIGIALDLPLSTIKMRLHRAKNTLRAKEAVNMAY
jgi:RNA polymerase sigma-70 factor (ECF subfamily)